MKTNQEKCYSLSFLIATPSSRTLDGLFELTQHPSRALNLALCFALEPRDTRTVSGVVPQALRSHS